MVNSLERLDGYDRDLLRYVLSWAPAGGPAPDDIMPRFGVSSRELRPRIRDIAYGALARRLQPDDHALVRQALELLRRHRYTLHQ
ncbi:MAG: hypothetical protein QOH91_175 [Mycobacterium sp.]|nr:hypothetical protein [Mycobacterium sp.]